MTRFPPGAPTGSTVDDFAAFLLSLLGYDEPASDDRVVHRRLEIGFIMCGTRVNSKPDICVMDRQDFLLLVQQDRVSSYCLLVRVMSTLGCFTAPLGCR